jgi:ribonucleoside-diphosphate reductase alpha chain
MYQTLANLSVPILPRFLNKAFWSYKTKFQYHPKAIIEFTRKIQRWIDTGISMEININPDICKINEISEAILDGFKSKELKAVYYSLTIGKDKKSGCTDCAN